MKHASASSDLPAGPIIFLGDSITEIWGSCRADLFRDRGFLCRGVGGETSRQIRARLKPALAEARATGLHLLCGINDIAENEGPVENRVIQDNIAAMLAEARTLGLRTWVGSITPADRIPWRAHVRPSRRIAEINDWLRGHAARNGTAFIDYHAILAVEAGALRADYGVDGVHLSQAGYEAMEPALLAALAD